MAYIKNELVKIQLRVHKPLGDYQSGSRDYFVAVVGPGIQLGNDDPNVAPRCQPVGHNFWVKDLWLPKDSRIYYKFLVVRSYTGVIVDIENIASRRLNVGQTPVAVDNTYNETTYKKKRATHKQSRARNDLKEKRDLQFKKAMQMSTDSAIKCAIVNEKTGYDVGECVATTSEIPEKFKTKIIESTETKDVQPHSTDNFIDQSAYHGAEAGNEDQSVSFNKVNVAISANGVSGEKGNYIGRKRLAVAVAGVALASCLGYFVFFKK